MSEIKDNNAIQLFEDKQIRTAWDAEREEWYFSIVDVIFVLTDQKTPRGGKVAGIARQTLEAETGKPVITSQNAADFRQLLTDIVEDAAALPEHTPDMGDDGKKDE